MRKPAIHSLLPIPDVCQRMMQSPSLAMPVSFVCDTKAGACVKVVLRHRNTCRAGVLDVMAAEERGGPVLGLVRESQLCLLALQSIALLRMLLHGHRLCWVVTDACDVDKCDKGCGFKGQL